MDEYGKLSVVVGKIQRVTIEKQLEKLKQVPSHGTSPLDVLSPSFAFGRPSPHSLAQLATLTGRQPISAADRSSCIQEACTAGHGARLRLVAVFAAGCGRQHGVAGIKLQPREGGAFGARSPARRTIDCVDLLTRRQTGNKITLRNWRLCSMPCLHEGDPPPLTEAR